jgi:hypothetical protein
MILLALAEPGIRGYRFAPVKRIQFTKFGGFAWDADGRLPAFDVE